MKQKKIVTIQTRRKLRRLAKARWARIHAEQAAVAQPVRVTTQPSPLEKVTALFTEAQSLDRASFEFFRALLGKTAANGGAAAVNGVRAPARAKMTGTKLARARERARRASQIRWTRHREKKAAEAATRQAV